MSNEVKGSCFKNLHRVLQMNLDYVSIFFSLLRYFSDLFGKKNSCDNIFGQNFFNSFFFLHCI